MSDITQPDAHILVVDDDERIRDLLKKFLSRHDYWVTTARDAAHARKLLEGLLAEIDEDALKVGS